MTSQECNRNCGAVAHMTGGFHRTDCAAYVEPPAAADPNRPRLDPACWRPDMVCEAAKVDEVICADDSCDYETGVRKRPVSEAEREDPVASVARVGLEPFRLHGNSLPQWQANDKSSPMPGELPRWSRPTIWKGQHPCGFATPPGIGARVEVKINDFGTGSVIGYFTEYGYLGVKVQLDKIPDWFARQSPGRNFVFVFGAEILPEKKGS